MLRSRWQTLAVAFAVVAAVAVGLTLAVVGGLLRGTADASPSTSAIASASETAAPTESGSPQTTGTARPVSLVVDAPALIRGLAAGDGGFIAWGHDAGPFPPGGGSVIVTSADAATWQLGSVPAGAVMDSSTVAWGPSGWLLVSANVTNDQGVGAWSSIDGQSWTSTGPWSLPAKVVPAHLVANASGYLLQVRDDRTGSSGAGLFFSANGATWTDVSIAGDFDQSVTTIGSGFINWVEDRDNGTRVHHSPDGRHWSTTSGDSLPRPLGNYPRIAALANSLVATTVTDDGSLRVWVAALPAGFGASSSLLTWQRSSTAEADLAGARGLALTSDGSRVVATGWSAQTGHPQAWSSTDGAHWTPTASANPFGGALPNPVVAGPRGFLGVAAADFYEGINPVIWRSSDGHAWQSSTVGALRQVDTPLTGACPELPTTLTEFWAIPAPIGLACFGHTPITYTAWLTVGGGCGGYFPGTFSPPWLAPPFARFPIIVTAVVADAGGCGDAARAPSLATIPPPQRWVQVTGHYDDPAAATCTYEPDAAAPGVMVGEQEMVLSCRQVFVATDVHEVPAPTP